MRNLVFKYAKAENFLCFGPKGIEINYEKYGNIVTVKAINLDVQDVGEKDASNGGGKSSTAEIPVYALFGKTIKKPKKLGHTEVINNQAKEMIVEFQWDDCRIIRTIKGGKKPKATLKFWKHPERKWDENSAEQTQGTMEATQAAIEREIGLNYDTFVNIYIFTDDDTSSFLECDSTKKREIIENLLSLEKYRGYHDSAKNFVKEAKDTLKLLSKDYDYLISELDGCKERALRLETEEKDWRADRKKELTAILTRISSKRDELEKTDVGTALARYKEAQEQMAEATLQLGVLETKRESLRNILVEAKKKQETILSNHQTVSKKFNDQTIIINNSEKLIEKNKKIISEVNAKTGKECPYCLSTVEEAKFANVITKAEAIINEESEKLTCYKETLDSIKSELQPITALKEKVEKGISDCDKKIADTSRAISNMHVSIAELSKIKEPEAGIEEQKIQAKIDELKRQAIEKKKQMDGQTPFEQIKAACVTEIKTKSADIEKKKKEIEKAEKELPYFEFWVKAFGDTGIRKYIIDGIIPALNARISYWLQFLIDNKIKLEFDNELHETIDRWPFSGLPYVYHGMSGGQRRRLRLTVSQAFAFIRMLNCGASPSVVFLDEVTMNMDGVGVDGIYRMICELSKEKQVFVIDHNPILLQMLEGCETIQLEMKNGVTTKTN